MAGKKKAKELLKQAYDAPNGVKINFCLVGNKYPAEFFFNNDLNEGEQNELISLFKRLGDEKGETSNLAKIKVLMRTERELIFEFKPYQVRVAYFLRPGRNYNLIYGFKKKTNKWPSKNLEAMKKNIKLFKKEEQRRK